MADDGVIGADSLRCILGARFPAFALPAAERIKNIVILAQASTQA
jgi:hypothetical protein